MNDDFVAGRSIGFDPRGDTVAFFARKGKRRSLFLVSVLTGKILRRVPMELDQAQAPCLLPDGRHALFAALKEGVSDIYLLDLETGATEEPDRGRLRRRRPAGLAGRQARRLHAAHQRPRQDLRVPPGPARAQDAAHLRRLRRHRAPLLRGRQDASSTPPTRTTTSPTCAASTCARARSASTRTCWAATWPPRPPRARAASASAFISYFKGEYRLQSIETAEPMKEVEQEVQVAAEDIVDFQPDVTHQVVPENKRKKRIFEKLFLEGRPPAQRGRDLQRRLLRRQPGRAHRRAGRPELHLHRALAARVPQLRRHLHQPGAALPLRASPPSTTRSSSTPRPTPCSRASSARAPSPPSATRAACSSASTRSTSSAASRSPPASSACARSSRTRRPSCGAQAAAAAQGLPFFLNNGSIAPLSLGLVGRPRASASSGRSPATPTRVSASVAPGVGGFLSRHTVEVDVRKYFRLGRAPAFCAARVRGFTSTGDEPGHLLLRRQHGAARLPLPRPSWATRASSRTSSSASRSST